MMTRGAGLGIPDLWVMSPIGQSNLLLIRRLLHPSTCDFDPIRGRFFAQVLPKFSATLAGQEHITRLLNKSTC